MTTIPFRLVADLRPELPYSIYAAPVARRIENNEPIEHRFAVQWDEDNDERVLALVAALYFSAQHQFRFVHAYAESKGTLSVWQLGFREDVTTAVQNAMKLASAAISDQWNIEVFENYLPRRAKTLPPKIRDAARGFMYLEASLCSADPKIAKFADTIITDTEAAQIEYPDHTVFFAGIKEQYRPGIDPDLAALHELYELGSFSGKSLRPWNRPRAV